MKETHIHGSNMKYKIWAQHDEAKQGLCEPISIKYNINSATRTMGNEINHNEMFFPTHNTHCHNKKRLRFVTCSRFKTEVKQNA